mgnify:CR=1 FL=1|jgi:hypothetical protein
MTLKMKQKTLSLFSFGILILALVLSSASAVITFDSVPNANPYGNAFNLGISSDISEDVVITIDTLTVNSNSIVFNGATATMVANTGQTLNMTYNTNNFNFELGQIYATIITATGQTSGNISTATLTFTETTLCEDCTNAGNLDLRIEDVKVIQGFGDDDNYWYPFDEVEVELQVENNGNWDIDNIEIEWALYTTDGKKIMDGTLNDFNLKDGKDETITFTFRLDEDIDDFENENAILYISAKGTIDDNDAGIHDNEDTCDSNKFETEVIADDDFVILNDIRVNGIELNKHTFEEYSLNCGQELILTADAWNIGDNDQESVTIQIYNKNLGINEIVELGDIDSYENTEITVYLDLPKDVDAKWYNLEIRVYDEDEEVFQNSQDDDAKFDVLFELNGNCGFVEPTISAELLTEAKENSEMTIKVTIKNQGSKSVIYTLNANGYSTWAELTEISEKEIQLNAGESKEVLFTFQTKKESAGERFFNIEIFSDNKLVTKQPVVVSIEDNQNKLRDFVNANWKVLIIGLVNLILIIAIIIVAVRTYRR